MNNSQPLPPASTGAQPPPPQQADSNQPDAGSLPSSPKKSDPSDQYQGPSLKEQKELLGQLKAKEKGMESISYKEYKETEVNDEVKDWMERLENGEDIKLNQPVVDDYGQILLDNTAPQKQELILPLKEDEVAKALQHKVVDSVRWLAEWCLRVIKIIGKRAQFKGAKTQNS